MLPLSLAAKPNGPLHVLCLGAHSDDIEIGCGGALLSLLASRPDVLCRWVVFTADDVREKEARASAASFLKNAKRSEVDVQRFRNGYFPFQGERIKDHFEGLKKGPAPDVIFTHYRDDRHQDHRVVSDLTWNTFRDHTILEYEIPKFDGDLGSPNLFVPLLDAEWKEKIRILEASFASQRDKHWFDADTFRALMRLRGVECAAPSLYAEAFYARKIVLSR